MVYSEYLTVGPNIVYRAFHCPGLRDITQDKLTKCEEGAGVLHKRNVPGVLVSSLVPVTVMGTLTNNQSCALSWPF